MPRAALLLIALAVAGAASLVAQVVSARLITPLTGAGVGPWAAVIAASLTGSALGSAAGARRVRAGRRGVAWHLFLGALATLGAVAAVPALELVGIARVLPVGVRAPILALLTAFPAALALAVPAPLVVERLSAGGRAGGRAAGFAFACGTLGALAGVWLAGFVLIPALTLNAIGFATAGVLATCAATIALVGEGDAAARALDLEQSATPILSPNRAALIAFLASFGLLTLELVAARLVARDLGGSFATWSGVIGVLLAGSAAGNAVGGWLADRRPGLNPLSNALVLAALSMVMVLVLTAIGSRVERLDAWLGQLSLTADVLIRATALFFVPAFLLGTVSPRLARLTGGGGEAAGHVAAWGSAGAVTGTLLTGTVLLGNIGAQPTLLVTAALAIVAAGLAAPLWRRPLALGAASLVLGAVGIGVTLNDPSGDVVRESDYATIRVQTPPELGGTRQLLLDKLIHSWVRPGEPGYLHYKHEEVQMEFLRAAPRPARVLVIGGGGYTFPRAARTLVPGCRVEVVEIDPAVTAVATEHLGLDPALGIKVTHADGRRFLDELAPPNAYDLITLDAVNDLSVPPHLLTRECAHAAKLALTPNGVYLVSVIDILNGGELWPAAMATLRTEFQHVTLLQSRRALDPDERAVFILYASDVPLDLHKLEAAQPEAHRPIYAHYANALAVRAGLAREPPVLTDQFAPVDQLMRRVYRAR